jgi:hypothetical protein
MTGDVGYRKPPVETRFKQGQSGNPSGRKKARQATLRESILDVLALPVAAMEKERVVSLGTLEGIFRRVCGKALKGDRRSLIAIFDLMLDFESKPDERPNREIDMAAARLRLKKRLGIDPNEPDPILPEPTEAELALKVRADAAIKRWRKRRAKATEVKRRRLFDT